MVPKSAKTKITKSGAINIILYNKRYPNAASLSLVDFKTKERYDIIISISTIEHIGWDEAKKDPKKALLAIKNLMKILKDGGKLILSFPLNYNHFLDEIIKTKKLPFSSKKILKKIKGIWVQIPFEEYVRGEEIAEPNKVLFIGEIKN